MKRLKKLLPLILGVMLMTMQLSACAEGDIFPKHEPYGEGIGAMAGRVVWSHEPDSVNWNGNGYWWEISNFDETVIQDMVDSSIAKLGGASTAADGWKALFTNRNERNGESGGYKAGEKIAIKANINGSAVMDDDTSGETQMSYTNPVLLKTLLISLVREAGVSPSDITVYDVSRLFPDYMTEMCNEGILQGVNFVTRDNGIADENAPIQWSYEFSGKVNYLPTCVTEAKYIINLANLKGHSYGITLCGKNHFGSFINGNAMRPPEGANLHQWLTKNEMGIYSPLVDLMANKHLGGKTVLYMLDAIICATSEGASITGSNSKWQQSPFNDDFTSSIFVSQDPVAIDSVGADFLTNESTIINNNSAAGNASVENYLHEAGLVAASPSGTVYTDSFGETITNLGVHEHWNNPTDKQYSRNLGKNEGIELVMANETESEPQLKIENGKIIVDNAVENGTLIVAFYKSGVLIGVRTYKANGQIEFDIESESNGDLSDATDLKAFFWDMETIKPLCNLLPVPLKTVEPTEKPAQTPTPIPTEKPTRVLTVYFSFTDNTKTLAEKIQGVTGSDIYEITPQEPYTDEILNYYSDNRAYREQNDADARPALSGSVDGMDNYDVIMLGYPIWYGLAPRVIYTFLESYDLSGKTIMPFCTSGSSPISGSLSDIRKLCPNSTITEGFRGTSSTTDAQIQAWIDNNIKEVEQGMKIRIGDKLFTATLEDNETVNALREMLPMTLDMSELNGDEKYHYLSQSLPTNTESIGIIHAGDIMLYGSNCIVIFYETFNASYSYTRIGHIDDVSELTAALGSGNVTVIME